MPPASTCAGSDLITLLQGFCHEGHCRRFPVLVGELGSRLRDCRNPCANREPKCMDLELQVDSCHPHFVMTAHGVTAS